ncbi:MAG: DNA polymerase [Xanthomonadales bacterium]|nr:DNA polymerase [Xanthomonadales bacterium]
MTRLFLDTETFCALGGPADLGTYRYAENAEILLVTYALDDDPVSCWDVTKSIEEQAEAEAECLDIPLTGFMPKDLSDALEDESVLVVAHHSTFDRNVLRLGNLRIDVPIERWRCTMIQALVHALPASLDGLGRTLGLPQEQQKIKEGRKLIQRFCKPAPKNHNADRYDRHTHPDEWQRFIRYAMQDVEAMREIHRRLPTWNWGEDTIAEWHLDQQINDRGFAVDRELVDAGVRAAVVERRRIAERFAQLTDGLAPTQRDKVRRFLNDTYGLGLEQTAKHVMAPIAADDSQPAEVREIAALMLAANKTSTAKYKTIRDALSSDGRFRGGLQFAGASRTRRWAGRTFQPQNLPSRGIPKPHVIEQYIEALKADCHDLLFDDLMLLGAAALRGVVIAPPGKKLVVSDLSNIEGRMLAWVAGEKWKIKAFRDYDAGTGHDLYVLAYANAFRIRPEDVTKDQRQIGKTMELGLGYGGGVGAFVTFAQAFGIDLDAMAERGRSTIPQDVLDEAANAWDWAYLNDRTQDLERDTWMVCDSFKRLWRRAHPETVNLWNGLDSAARKALKAPGRTFRAGPYLRVGVREHAGHRYLLIKLPSGRYLVYFDPMISEHNGLTYMGMGNEEGGTAKVWCRVNTYSGKICENLCQGLARDVLAANMPAIEDAGYDLILSVHDENLTEAPNDPTYSEADLSRHMATVPEWADGLPLASAGFEATRYRKG